MGRVRRRRARLQPFRFVTRRVSAGRSGSPVARALLTRSVVVAFEGWNDAADAASYAVTSLARVWQAAPFAEIDPEEFFDFTEARPELTVLEGLVREITWPATVFSVAPGPVDVVVVRGPEPQLRWRA